MLLVETQNSGSAQWDVAAGPGYSGRYFLVRFPYSEGFAAKMHFVAKKHLTASPDISLKDYSRPCFQPIRNNGELLTKAMMRLFFLHLGKSMFYNFKYVTLSKEPEAHLIPTHGLDTF